MALTLDQITEELTTACSQISQDEPGINIVAHIGPNTEPLGTYIANQLGAKKIWLPSLNRKSKKQGLVNVLNRMYDHVPEIALRILAEGYKFVYSREPREMPNGALDSALTSGSGILLVDDNAFTGITLERWKSRIQEDYKGPVRTFTITVTGQYVPDYHLIDSWRSFEWRKIGI